VVFGDLAGSNLTSSLLSATLFPCISSRPDNSSSEFEVKAEDARNLAQGIKPLHRVISYFSLLPFAFSLLISAVCLLTPIFQKII
jgi:hypothetical protein